ncbi:glycosyltransferase family 2 protein [Rubellimicrobium arenae]|uniref:glycosyltransferase family 2 protein n=1 Tax=Rubellimicrobium arenae TaxID=2817372 RepID=UPI001B3006BD|nr:glycosyltransferase [Rubellimicrobium arenae]
MPPSISVVINNYNYGTYLGSAIESALGQDYDGIVQTIVVDDGSTDHSRQVLSQYAGRITAVLKENGGQASALNAGVRASSGDILCFLDADDWWAPGKLTSVVAEFRSDPRCSLVYHRLQPVRADGTPTLKPIPRTLCRGDLQRRLERSAGWWPFPMTSAVAVRRAAWEAAGDIPETFRISADAWLVGIYPFLGRVAASPDSLGFYRLHQNHWYRETDDAAMLQRRMAHWASTVEATNTFLAHRGGTGRLSIDDHLPYQVARARLQGADLRACVRLTLKGLTFGGEPNHLRRARDVARALAAFRAGALMEREARAGADRARAGHP